MKTEFMPAADFPNICSGKIPGDPFGRTFAELDHWYRQRGTSLRERCIRLLGDPVVRKKARLLQLAYDGAPRPETASENSEERRLAKALRQYTRKGKMYDVEFDRELRQLRPDWFPLCSRNLAKRNKSELLKLAKAGRKRPARKAKDLHERSLAVTLQGATNKKGPVYDEVFDKRIRKLAPSWFAHSLAERKYKLELLKLAGSKRPSRKAKDLHERRLANVLCKAMNKRHPLYDEVFSARIRKLAPSWFRSERAERNKLELLKLAKAGNTRPSRKAKDLHERGLASTLYIATRRDYVAYDKVFDAKIRKLAPSWFLSAQELSARNKRALLKRAKTGGKRPPIHTKDLHEKSLATTLRGATNKGPVYDEVFDVKIRKLAPEWFLHCIARRNKRELLKLAKVGNRRPSKRTDDPHERSLANTLYRATGRRLPAYDKVFDRKIRKLAPGWFRK